MAILTVREPNSKTPVNLGSTNPSVGGDSFLNDGRVIFYVKNTNAATRTVTIVTSGFVGHGHGIEDLVFTVAQNEEKVVGPFPPRYFNDSQGFVSVTYSGVTNVSVAAIKLT